ncbi:hypothetical protein IA69_04925 [Massilia sp. JS1662]|nr:hypothetical protein IA69_04925 [Massilia sp. JS1662]
MIADGQVTSIHVPGITILDQFETSAGYLLVTDHNCPFEETFHFILLDRNLHIRAHRSLGAAFSFVPGNQVRTLEELVWEDDRHFLAILTGPAERWRFTIRPSGIPFIHPRLTATRA